MSATSVLAICAALTPHANALTVRDDVTVPGSEDYADDPKWDGVVQIYHLYPDGFLSFNCTGTLINPRTVLTAAHCFGSVPSSAFDESQDLITPIVAYGPDTFDALYGWLNTGADTSRFELDDRNGLVLGNQAIIHPDSDPMFGPDLDFPAADIALISLSSPLSHLPTYAMLFSPVGVGEHVTMVAYGSDGTGLTGEQGIEGKRQAGENIIGLIGSQNDFIGGIFQTDVHAFDTPGADQSLYWIDFDNPDRTGDECSRDSLGNYACVGADSGTSFAGKLILPDEHIDYFPGDALPYESGTASGDSGSAIFFDQLGAQPLIGGVLSGGFTFTTPIPSGYGDVSYYNPLFNFYSFIIEANPYKYVSAQAGDTNWSDPSHWVQTLDPSYFVFDENGGLINGVPDVPEPGVAGITPVAGTVLDTPIGVSQTGNSYSLSGTAAATRPSVATLDISKSDQLYTAPELITYLYGDIGSPGPLTGPGATNFVPANGRNANGFFNYFDVTLSAPGTTTLDMNVEVDRLALIGPAALQIGSEYYFGSLIDTKVMGGALYHDGILLTRDFLNAGGYVSGSGYFQVDTFWNAGYLNPTYDTTSGYTMFIAGDLVLTSGSTLIHNKGAPLIVQGDVSIDGSIILNGAYAYGDAGSLIEYDGTAMGGFDDIDLPGVLYVSFADTQGPVLRAYGYEIMAADFATELSTTDQNILSLASALDNARSPQNKPIYAQIDYLSGAPLANAIEVLIPSEPFSLRRVLLAGPEQLSLQMNRRFSQITNGDAGGTAFRQSGRFGVQTASGSEMSAFAMAADQAATLSDGNEQENWGAFVEVVYFTGDERNGFSGASSNLEGTSITAGLDGEIDENLRFGGFFNYTDTDTDDNSGTMTSTEGFLAGVYGSYTFGNNAALSAYAGWGEQDASLTRIQGLTGTQLSGDTTAEQFILGIDVSRQFKAPGFIVEPSLGIDYYDAALDKYGETGGAGALIYDDQGITSAQAHIGALIHVFDPASDTNFRPTLGGRFINDLSDETPEIDARFLSGGIQSSFATNGVSTDDSWFEVNANVELVSSTGIEVSGFAAHTFDRDELEYTSFGLSARKTF